MQAASKIALHAFFGIYPSVLVEGNHPPRVMQPWREAMSDNVKDVAVKHSTQMIYDKSLWL